jgi:geranylgeranyl reductase family protein
VPTVDVAVVGGGPAGAAAAITLARSGRRVLVVDKARFPRDKCCGDGLTTGALRRLEALGLRPDAVSSWQPVEELSLRSPSGRTNTYSLPRSGTHAAVARRAHLDAALLEVASTAGAEVRDGHALISARSDDSESVVLEVDGIGHVTSRFVVGADGMWSPLRKALGASEEPGYLGEAHAFRQYFSHVNDAAATRMWVWFEEDLLPGYAWSFPLPGRRANVGFGVKRRPGVSSRVMKEQWADLLRRPQVVEVLGEGATPEGAHKAWPIPARLERTQLSAANGRALFVGDAARATDPLTGEGIAQALETGILAAGAIVEAGAARPDVAAERYRRNVGRGMAVDNRFAGFLARIMSNATGVRASVRISGMTGWTRRNFVRWLFEDYPRAVLATPHRWGPGMLGGAGAYVEA